jgi:hypothetical protein
MAVLAALSLFATPAVAAKLQGGDVVVTGGAVSAGSIHLYGSGSAFVGRVSDGATNLLPSPSGGIDLAPTTFSGQSGSQWQLVALPLNDAGNPIASTLEEFGPPDSSGVWMWRLGHWNPATATYDTYENQRQTAVPVGTGFWVLNRHPTSYSMSGMTLPDSVTLQLSGPANSWYQLGNPFEYAVSVSGWRVSSGGTTALLTDPANVFVENTVKTYTAGVYSGSSTIGEGAGFWVKKVVAGDVQLTLQDQAVSPAPIANLVAKPTGAQWALSVSAGQGSKRSETLVLGAAPVRDAGWNALCSGVAPSPPDGGLQLFVEEPAWGAMSGAYARVFQRESDVMTFDVSLDGARAGEEVTLEFHRLGVAEGARIALSDPAGGWGQEVADGERVTLVAGTGTRRLRLQVSSVSSALPPATPPSTEIRDAYPNPSSRSTSIAFTLAEASNADLTVYDAAGRAVHAESRLALSPGEHAFAWDGSRGNGSSVPPGIYFARVRGGGVSRTLRIVRVASTQ